MDKLEFGSVAWVDRMRLIVEEELAGEDLRGIEYSICEEFTDPPAHLRRGGGSSIGVWIRISGGKVEVGDGVLEDATDKTIVDYDAILPLGSAVIRTPEQVTSLLDFAARAMAEGKLRLEPPTQAAVYDKFIKPRLDLHNRMAVLTEEPS